MHGNRPLDEAAWLWAMRFWIPSIPKGFDVTPQEAKLAVFALDLLGPGESGRGGLVGAVAETCGWPLVRAEGVLMCLHRAGFVTQTVPQPGDESPAVRYFTNEAAIVEAAGVLA